MARALREWVEGGLYHVFSRGSNRQAIFLNDRDTVEFDMLFATTVSKNELDVFGWSFMPNHWHGILRCPAGGLSRFMKEVNQRYAIRFDRRWDRTAHVFTNRFGAVLQETEQQLLWTLRYVVRNPVEAGLCASPFDAKWTSFAATAGLAPTPFYLRVKEILELLRQQAGRRARPLHRVRAGGERLRRAAGRTRRLTCLSRSDRRPSAPTGRLLGVLLRVSRRGRVPVRSCLWRNWHKVGTPRS